MSGMVKNMYRKKTGKKKSGKIPGKILFSSFTSISRLKPKYLALIPKTKKTDEFTQSLGVKRQLVTTTVGVRL